MRQYSSVILLGHKVILVLNDGDGSARCIEDKDGRFIMEFNGLMTDRIMTHECWHMMFMVLDRCEKEKVSFKELISEVYAYTFEDFCVNVKYKITGMRLYKRIYGQKGKD